MRDRGGSSGEAKGGGRRPTFLFQKDTALCNHDGDISVDVTLSMFINERDGDIGVGYALSKGDTEDTLLRSGFCSS